MLTLILSLSLSLFAQEKAEPEVMDRCFVSNSAEIMTDAKVTYSNIKFDEPENKTNYKLEATDSKPRNEKVNLLKKVNEHNLYSYKTQFKSYLIYSHVGKEPILRCSYADKASKNISSVLIHGKTVMSETHCVKNFCLTTHENLCAYYNPNSKDNFNKIMENLSPFQRWKKTSYSGTSDGYPYDEVKVLNNKLMLADVDAELAPAFDGNDKPQADLLKMSAVHKEQLLTFLNRSCARFNPSGKVKSPPLKPNQPSVPIKGSALPDLPGTR